MTKTTLIVLAMAFALSACEPAAPTETTTESKPSPTTQASPSSPAIASPESGSSTSAALKAGDKVKAVNGSFSDATVVSVDEKAGKANVKIAGQPGEKTVALTDLVKQ